MQIIPHELSDMKDEILPILEESLTQKHIELGEQRLISLKMVQVWRNSVRRRLKKEPEWEETAEFKIFVPYFYNSFMRNVRSLESQIKKISASIKEYLIEELPVRHSGKQLDVEGAKNTPCEDIATQFGVELIKSSKYLRGSCPLHNEKTASFFVDTQRNTWICFGCGAKGDSISLYMTLRGCEFVDAVKQLTS